jgi:hypothetical protein
MDKAVEHLIDFQKPQPRNVTLQIKYNTHIHLLVSRKISVNDNSTATELPQTKQCTRCLLIKPRAEFHKDNKSKDGRSTRCRSCKAEGRRQQKQEKRQGGPSPVAGSIATLILEYNEASRQKKRN